MVCRVLQVAKSAKRINMVMQAVFFQSSGVLPMDEVSIDNQMG
jgi:Pyruvate/2-oxoacid:ferredoxin oxidoreductase gamma subunit